MENSDGLEQLQGLHRDLIAFSQGQLRNVERLWAELDARVDEFRQLLDKPSKNESSRKILSEGRIQSQGEDYAINKEFQENAIQLADALDLDELESAKLILDTQNFSRPQDGTINTTAIINFHQRRESTLDCLRLTLAITLDSEAPNDARVSSREIIELLLGRGEEAFRQGPAFVHKCLRSMIDVERWLQAVSQRTQGALALGGAALQDVDELASYIQQSLCQQHESLAGVATLLIRSSYSTAENFTYLLDHVAQIDRWGPVVIHYAPVLLALISQHGSPDGTSSLHEARALHTRIMDSKGVSNWALQYFQAAVQAWWLAEYSGWYQEPQSGSPVEGVDIEAEAIGRSKALFRSLKEGAFECTLTTCTIMMQWDEQDPARSSLASFLLREAVMPKLEMIDVSQWFILSFMEQLEIFVDALITNMPDTLRQFKFEEDDQRKRIYSNLQTDSQNGYAGQDFHLERFLLICSYAFEGRADAAQAFWGDNDSNLYGFLQWASKRQSTPCVSAFCELLQSISKTEECATAAHRFLLDESGGTASRVRKYGSIAWSQILSELLAFTSRIREPQISRKSNSYVGGKPGADDIDEPESVFMLESYIRLMSHICAESPEARAWISSQTNPPMLETLFTLCSSAVPGSLQACSFSLIRSLLTSKSSETNMTVWQSFDAWASGAFAPANAPRLSKGSGPNSWLEAVTFNIVMAGWDQANSFTLLLQALLDPPASASPLNDQLTFPENLGSSYRPPGVEPYIDLVVDRILRGILNLSDDEQKVLMLNRNILSLLNVCLATFNEDLLLVASRSSMSVDEAMSATNLATYVKLHPFSRTMEWLFNEGVLERIFKIVHAEPDELVTARPNHLISQTILLGLELMIRLCDLQSTYMNVVKPMLKNQTLQHRESLSNPALASFEDSVALHLSLITDLSLYAGLGDQALACAALKLLGKLTTSKRLRALPGKALDVIGRPSPLLRTVQREDELERMVQPLARALEIKPREIELGPCAADAEIKASLLDFLASTISASPNQPTIAHAFLGFEFRNDNTSTNLQGALSRNAALLHAILEIVVAYPDYIDDNFRLWALNLRRMAMEVLWLLWNSPMTSQIALYELRATQFLSRLFIREKVVNMDFLWEDQTVWSSSFLYDPSASALQGFLRLRELTYEYINTELRFIEQESGPSLKDSTLSILLGLTLTPEGDEIRHCNILDLIDFADIQVTDLEDLYKLEYFANIDLESLSQGNHSQDSLRYDTRLVEQVLGLRLEELRRRAGGQDPEKEQNAMDEARDIILFTIAVNHLKDIRSANQHAFAAWSKSISLTLDFATQSENAAAMFLLQGAQILTPKMETYTFENDARATYTAKLLRRMVVLLIGSASGNDAAHASDVPSDRAYQVFRAALRSISAPGNKVELREVLYEVCLSYLSVSRDSKAPLKDSPRNMHAIKTAGTQALEILCDDILGARSSTRLSALWLLTEICVLASQDHSSFVLDTLVRTNFLQILVESIERMPDDLRCSRAQEVQFLLKFYETTFTFLLVITQSRQGAEQVLKAGLFHAVQESGLFSVDPDIGIEIDNSDALAKYYRLLLFLTRTIVSTVSSHGAQNVSTIDSGRAFVKDNRPLIVATLKRQAKVGGVSFDDAGINIDELTELFILLMSVTDYLEFEDSFESYERRHTGFS